MSSSADEDGEGGGLFTRKALLEGVTKGAGVLGAGTFVQKGLFAGVPYHGNPDLTGKVRHATRDQSTRHMTHDPACKNCHSLLSCENRCCWLLTLCYAVDGLRDST